MFADGKKRATMSGSSQLVDAVMLAEFDIDKGSVCRVQYPREVGDAGLLAELMLPEGAHNHSQDWTVFMLNRPAAPVAAADSGVHDGASGGSDGHARGEPGDSGHDGSDASGGAPVDSGNTSSSLGAAAAPTAASEPPCGGQCWAVHAYRYQESGTDDPGWVLMDGGESGEAVDIRDNNDDGDGAHAVTLELASDGQPLPAGATRLIIVVELGGGQRLRLQHHDELQYSALQGDFASMYSLEGEAYGLHFREVAQQESFAAAVEKAAAAAVPPQPMLWCLNHVSNRRDATVRRGAQVKALAIASRYQWVHVWKPVLLLAVDRMYSLSTGYAPGGSPLTPKPTDDCARDARTRSRWRDVTDRRWRHAHCMAGWASTRRVSSSSAAYFSTRSTRSLPMLCRR